MSSFDALARAVEAGEKDDAARHARAFLGEGGDARKAIDDLTKVMGAVGEKFSRLEIFLPEMILSGEAMAAAVEILGETLKGGGAGTAGKVVLGTVKGDLHEIGKNIVKLMLEANGYQVKDLGYDVDSLRFIKEAEAFGADFIAMSSLMTTTMPHQQEVIQLLKDRGLRDKYKVVIGGAPTTEEWARQIGADLYCMDAGAAPKQLAALLK